MSLVRGMNESLILWIRGTKVTRLEFIKSSIILSGGWYKIKYLWEAIFVIGSLVANASMNENLSNARTFVDFFLSDPDFSLLKKKFLQKKRNKKIAQISYCMFFNKNLWNYYYVFLQYLQLFQSKNEKMKLQAHSFIFFSWSSAIAITQKFRCASSKSFVNKYVCTLRSLHTR